MYALTMNEVSCVSGGSKILKAEAMTFTDIAVAAALVGAEPVTIAAGVAAAVAETELYFGL